eukprot:TRINITY_DN28143_c0_g1_i1.p2 TRINITY_DN28143_c0_g1~~TRINITY_DN28143_c0_g1_i1.p2  ORF type:complete len:280 (+),score=67.48 TRINITY_DN28143_c0_g1_i1:244-1083(+)
MSWIDEELVFIYGYSSLPRWFFLVWLIMWLCTLLWSLLEIRKAAQVAAEAMTATQQTIRWQIFALFVVTNVLQIVIALCYLAAGETRDEWPREAFDAIGIGFLVIDTITATVELKLVSFWVRVFVPKYVVVWRALRWSMYLLFLGFFALISVLRVRTHNALLMEVAGAVLGLTCSLMHLSFGAFLLLTIDRYAFLTWAPTRPCVIKVIRVVCAGTVVYFLRGMLDLLFALDPRTFSFVTGQPVVHLIQYCPLPQWLIMYSFGLWAASLQEDRKGLLAAG